MKMSEAPLPAAIRPSSDAAATLSSVRTVVEPTQKTRPPRALQALIASAAPGGTVLLFGVPGPDARLSLPLFDVYKKELTIRGSMINPDTHQRAVELLNSGRLDADSLITHHYFTDQLEEAILMQQSSESIKVMVHPR